MVTSVGFLIVNVAMLLVGAFGGVAVTTRLMLDPPPICTVDPLLAEELARQTLLLERIAGYAEAEAGRTHQALQEVERRRQRLQQDALTPGQVKGLGSLPTRMEVK
jgi:hypothetical protein